MTALQVLQVRWFHKNYQHCFGRGDTQFPHGLCPLALLARPGGGHGRGGGEYALARPSSDSLSGRLRVGFAWRGPYAALRKAAYAEGASCASTGRCAPPACSWWKAVPPCVCSVDRAGRRRRSAAASAAGRCSTPLPGEQPPGAVRGVCEAALALWCRPRRVARGTRGAARGPDGARERAR